MPHLLSETPGVHASSPVNGGTSFVLDVLVCCVFVDRGPLLGPMRFHNKFVEIQLMPVSHLSQNVPCFCVDGMTCYTEALKKVV